MFFQIIFLTQAVPYDIINLVKKENIYLSFFRKATLDMENKTFNILFVGNSYTYYNQMPQMAFTQLAEAEGYKVIVASVTRGGYSLSQFADPENEEGKRLREVIKGNRYDYAVLQEQSTKPITNEAEFIQGASDVMDLICADEFILYATWGRNDGCPMLAELGLSREEMTEKLSAAYNSAGNKLGVRVAEVGKAFWEYSKCHDKDELYDPDKTHPSALGSEIAARVIFKKIIEHSENT